MAEPTTIDVYPVGVLRAIRERRRRPLQSELKRVVELAEQRKWRSLRSAFNGYLAEVSYPPEGLNHRRCGHGWTKRRATRRLGQYLAHDNATAAGE